MYEKLTPIERIEQLELTVVRLVQKLTDVVEAVNNNTITTHALQHILGLCEEHPPDLGNLTQNFAASLETPVPEQDQITPEEGYLDVASFVEGRLGVKDMNISLQFGQICGRAGRSRGLEPKKITSPGEHWRFVNTWPIEFLREMWNLSYGGGNV